MSRSALLRLLVLGGIWGTSFLLISWSLEGLSPTQIALGRASLGALVLWPVALASGGRPPRDLRLWGQLLVMSLVSNVVPFFLFGWGQERVTSGLAGIYNALTPLTTLLIAVALLPEERPTLERVVGFLVAVSGAGLILGGDIGGSTVPGQLACLGAAFSYGLAFNYARRVLVPRGIPPRTAAACQLTCAALVLLVLAPVVARDPVDLDARVLLSIGVLGAVGTGIAFVIYHSLIRDIGASRASMVTFLIPIVAVSLGVVVLDEALTWQLLAGGVVIIAGVALAEGRLGRLPRRDVSLPNPVRSQP